jgi:hypothetical protein
MNLIRNGDVFKRRGVVLCRSGKVKEGRAWEFLPGLF